MQSWVSYKSSILCDVEYGLCLCESVVVTHPSRCDWTMWGSMLWFEQCLKMWRWLIPSWHVVLESAKDWILWVDTPEQHVSPHVRYETTCLLIRNTIGLCVSVGWVGIGIIPCGIPCDILYDLPKPHGARGAFDGESVAKPDILL
jgi:hypothetical protein